MYSISSLATPYSYITTMMCTLFGYSNTNKFLVEWVPLTEEKIDSYIIGQGTILSNNIASQIRKFRQNWYVTTRVVPPFFMSVISWMKYVSLYISRPWDGNGPFKTPLLSIYIIKSCGNLISIHNFIKFAKKSCCQYTKPFLIKEPQEYLKRPKLT